MNSTAIDLPRSQAPTHLERWYVLVMTCTIYAVNIADRTAWLLSLPAMTAPRRVLWLLGTGVGIATLPSFIAYWTHTLWLSKLMLWLYIPAIYFFIGPCMGLLQNLAPAHLRSMFIALSLVVGNVLNLIVAPQAVGFASDFFAHGGPTDAASLRLALLLLAPTGFWAVGHFYLASRTVIADLRRALGHEQGHRG